MFCITQNGKVFYGPINWDKQYMQSLLYKKWGLNQTLPYVKSNSTPIIVEHEDGDIKILSVTTLQNPSYNATVEMLVGPEWNIYDDYAEEYYTVSEMSVPDIRTKAKNHFKEERKKLQDEGLNITIDGVEYWSKVNETTISSFKNGIPGNWKLTKRTKINPDDPLEFASENDVWVVLNQDQLDTICVSLQNKLQELFDLEKVRSDQIDAVEDVESFKSFTTELQD